MTDLVANTGVAAAQLGAVEIRWHRGWAACVLIGCSSVAAIGAIMTMAALPQQWLVGAFCALITAGMLAGAWRGLALLRRPMLMFQADREGIVTYWQDNGYGDSGHRVPWDQVATLKLTTRLAGNGRRVRSIAVHLCAPHPLADALSFGGSDDPRVLHLDAGSGNLQDGALLRALDRCRHGAGLIL